MRKKKISLAPVRKGTPPVSAPAVSPDPLRQPKLMLIDLPHGTSIDAHPEVAPLLREGWRVKSVDPRIGRRGEARHLAVLLPPGTSGPGPAVVRTVRLDAEPEVRGL